MESVRYVLIWLLCFQACNGQEFAASVSAPPPPGPSMTLRGEYSARALATLLEVTEGVSVVFLERGAGAVWIEGEVAMGKSVMIRSALWTLGYAVRERGGWLEVVPRAQGEEGATVSASGSETGPSPSPYRASETAQARQSGGVSSDFTPYQTTGERAAELVRCKIHLVNESTLKRKQRRLMAAVNETFANTPNTLLSDEGARASILRFLSQANAYSAMASVASGAFNLRVALQYLDSIGDNSLVENLDVSLKLGSEVTFTRETETRYLGQVNISQGQTSTITTRSENALLTGTHLTVRLDELFEGFYVSHVSAKLSTLNGFDENGLPQSTKSTLASRTLQPCNEPVLVARYTLKSIVKTVEKIWLFIPSRQTTDSGSVIDVFLTVEK